ncbi:uncharacterized protein LOC106702928 isoform X2 [Latimeria chalumnae]|uniref:uncharacterized protein LOC106702928 isoform X2 n=1 Tax=Latimeria chalumnae TaxID=7897 RepID=UPI0006D8DD70|nr:PREDICTED: uncharacterized protein LOC106702928 isoform X2 [Latimeria chalumnae]|eukprot:XP_014342118.1 PREDICTED: uncharacterized protein LOC106702928 isoform X2 [Latimeria chalumnae]
MPEGKRLQFKKSTKSALEKIQCLGQGLQKDSKKNIIKKSARPRTKPFNHIKQYNAPSVRVKIPFYCATTDGPFCNEPGFDIRRERAHSAERCREMQRVIVQNASKWWGSTKEKCASAPPSHSKLQSEIQGNLNLPQIVGNSPNTLKNDACRMKTESMSSKEQHLNALPARRLRLTRKERSKPLETAMLKRQHIFTCHGITSDFQCGKVTEDEQSSSLRQPLVFSSSQIGTSYLKTVTRTGLAPQPYNHHSLKRRQIQLLNNCMKLYMGSSSTESFCPTTTIPLSQDHQTERIPSPFHSILISGEPLVSPPSFANYTGKATDIDFLAQQIRHLKLGKKGLRTYTELQKDVGNQECEDKNLSPKNPSFTTQNSSTSEPGLQHSSKESSEENGKTLQEKKGRKEFPELQVDKTVLFDNQQGCSLKLEEKIIKHQETDLNYLPPEPTGSAAEEIELDTFCIPKLDFQLTPDNGIDGTFYPQADLHKFSLSGINDTKPLQCSMKASPHGPFSSEILEKETMVPSSRPSNATTQAGYGVCFSQSQSPILQKSEGNSSYDLAKAQLFQDIIDLSISFQGKFLYNDVPLDTPKIFITETDENNEKD